MTIKSALAVSALVASAALGLTGCAGASNTPAETPAAAVTASTAPVATATATEAPVAAATPTAAATATYSAADLEKYKKDPNLVSTIKAMTTCDEVRTVIYSLMDTVNQTKTTGDKTAGVKAMLTLADAGNKAKALNCPGANK